MYAEHGAAQPGVSSYDDFVIGFEYEVDARRVMDVLTKRLEHRNFEVRCVCLRHSDDASPLRSLKRTVAPV